MQSRLWSYNIFILLRFKLCLLLLLMFKNSTLSLSYCLGIAITIDPMSTATAIIAVIRVSHLLLSSIIGSLRGGWTSWITSAVCHHRTHDGGLSSYSINSYCTVTFGWFASIKTRLSHPSTRRIKSIWSRFTWSVRSCSRWLLGYGRFWCGLLSWARWITISILIWSLRSSWGICRSFSIRRSIRIISANSTKAWARTLCRTIVRIIVSCCRAILSNTTIPSIWRNIWALWCRIIPWILQWCFPLWSW